MGRQSRPQVVGTSNVDLFRKTDAFEEIDVDQPSAPSQMYRCTGCCAAKAGPPAVAPRKEITRSPSSPCGLRRAAYAPPSQMYPCTGCGVAKAGLPAEAPPKGGRRLVEPGGIEPPTS